MERFLGGPVGPTLVKLALASVAVGLVLAGLGVDPLNIWRDFTGTLVHIWGIVLDMMEQGLDLAAWLFKYLLIGAIIIIPVWVVIRLWHVFVKRRRG